MKNTLKSNVPNVDLSINNGYQELCVEKDSQAYVEGVLRSGSNMCHKPESKKWVHICQVIAIPGLGVAVVS